MIGGGRCAEHNPSETEGMYPYIQMYVSSIWIDIKVIRCGLESYVQLVLVWWRTPELIRSENST